MIYVLYVCVKNQLVIELTLNIHKLNLCLWTWATELDLDPSKEYFLYLN